MPMSLDAPLAPGIGGAVTAGTIALCKAFAKPGGFVNRRAGVVGIGVGIVASALTGLARGTGAGVASGVTSVIVGGGYEAIQKVQSWRLNRLSTPVTPPTTPPIVQENDNLPASTDDATADSDVGIDSGIKGLSFVRARVGMRGMGAGPRGYLPANGSSPIDVLRTGFAVPAF
jgi:hypothetical protein